MKAYSSLIWAYGIVKLHTIPDVYLHVPLIVNPWDTKRDNPVGFDETFDYL